MANSFHSSNLDAVRAYAVICVLSSHFIGHNGLIIPWLSYFNLESFGGLAIALFFVHSTTVVLFSIERLSAIHQKIFWPYAKERLFRIYPLSIFIVLIYFFFQIPSAIGMRPVYMQIELWPNLLLVQNILSGTSSSIVMWSLSYELQFCLTLPFIYYSLKKYNKTLLFIIAIWILMLLASFIFTPMIEVYNYGSNYLKIPKVFIWFSCFLPGVMAYTFYKKQLRQMLPSWCLFFLLIGLSVLSSLMEVPVKNSILVFIFAGLIPFIKESECTFLNKLAFLISKFSYSIYMSHMLSLLIFVDPKGTNSISYRLAVYLASTAALSLGLYYLIEKPFRAWGRSSAKIVNIDSSHSRVQDNLGAKLKAPTLVSGP